MKQFASRPVLLGIVWLVLLACRTGDVIARAQPTATSTVTRTVRPTFTRVPPTAPPTPTLVPAPTVRPVTATRVPTARPAPTRTLPLPPTAPPPPPPTADLYQGYYYRVAKSVCTPAQNTRAEGTVYDNGVPQNGVRVRIANGNGGSPVIDDFITGVDPSDYKHVDPALQGKYRLGLAEGQQMDGNWWVFIVDSNGQQISVGAYFKTSDTTGCNTAAIDFAHN
ncbi:MAG: hypothetical protein HY782_00075 [Chloroflexi bacterium]|nr:hypothetical protein [Chloroflexota bacterium]